MVEVDAKKQIHSLTYREIECIMLIAQGMNNQDICASLCISQPTLKTHMNNFYSKLGMWQCKENPNSVRRVQVTLYFLKHEKEILKRYNLIKLKEKHRRELEELNKIIKLTKERDRYERI